MLRGLKDKFNIFFNLAILGALVGLVSVVLFINVTGGRAVETKTVYVPEYTLPARFNGQGAVTVGCALWDQTEILPYTTENPNSEYFALEVDSDHMLFLFDGPTGTYLVSGSHCGISVDYSALPTQQRTPPKDKQANAP